MTKEQKDTIIRLRAEGQGYTAIAKETGVPKETVKTFCRRNSLGGMAVQPRRNADGRCPQCGKEVEQKTGFKPRRFCSPECRQAWWNSHPEQVGRKAVYDFVCAGCGRPFTSYGNRSRKYCSHDCYTRARFGGGMASDERAI